MFKRFCIIVFLICFYYAFFLTIAFAQDLTDNQGVEEVFDFQKAYKDYIFAYEVYRKAEADYLLARSQYKEAGTLISQTKVRDKTVAMLQTRDDVITTYLTSLRMKLLESEGIADTDKNGLFARLDSEISWYKNHRSQIPSAGTLGDLVNDSNEARDHFSLVEPLAYEVLATIPFGKIEIFKSRVNLILSDIKTKVQKIRANGDHDTSITERWIIETENKITRSLDKEIDAQKLIFSLQSSTGDRNRKVDHNRIYSNIVSLLQESNQFLREADSYMKEIVKQLKTEQS